VAKLAAYLQKRKEKVHKGPSKNRHQDQKEKQETRAAQPETVGTGAAERKAVCRASAARSRANLLPVLHGGGLCGRPQPLVIQLSAGGPPRVSDNRLLQRSTQ